MFAREAGDDEVDNRQFAQASWILENLYIDPTGALECSGAEADGKDAERQSSEIALLLFEAINYGLDSRAIKNSLSWLSQAFLTGCYLLRGFLRADEIKATYYIVMA